MPTRPPFIVSAADVPETLGQYPNDDEPLAHGRAIGKAAGLKKIGVHIERVPPGHRISWPHAEEAEEEFVFVLAGEVDAWIDGHLHPMCAGDLAAFPSGTGICHTFINNSQSDARLLVGGEASKPEHRIYYPLHPHRKAEKGDAWWDDVPLAPQGPHDGKPNARR